MRIIHIVDHVGRVNYGIWSAAVILTPWLLENHIVKSEIWFPAETLPETMPDFYGAEPVPLANTKVNQALKTANERGLNVADTIIITHGTWRYPTLWGKVLKRAGYKWQYVPHGMLEPWSMQQKAFKKKLYFHLIELPAARAADMVRAVGAPELVNLRKYFPKAVLRPNGVPLQAYPEKDWHGKRHVLFMARLHHKKGIIPLMKAWLKSDLNRNDQWQLVIAGPDDGELGTLQELLAQNPETNIQYLGSVYGAQKQEWLLNSHFYALPTVSEGFPTSVVEAMQAGLVPLTSKGANFPEAMEAGLMVELTQEEKDIVSALHAIAQFSEQEYHALSTKCKAFINQGYTLDVLGQTAFQDFQKLLKAV